MRHARLVALTAALMLMAAPHLPARADGAPGGRALRPAVAEEISLVPHPAARINPAFSIFPSDTTRMTFSAEIPVPAKMRAEFVWTAPDGGVRRTVKLCYPARGGETANIWDSATLPDDPARRTGPWSVEVVLPDRILSNKFILTENRHLLAAANGDLAERLAALGALADGPEALQTADVALSYPDAGTRAAAARALARLSAPGARERLARLADDPAPEVRREAFGTLLAGGSPPADISLKAAMDADAGVRQAAAVMLALTPDTLPAFLLLIKDGDPKVREAALKNLSRREGPLVYEAASGGMEVDDPVFRRDVMGLIEGRADAGASVAGFPGLADADTEIRLRSVRLAGKGGGLSALRPFVSDPDARVAAEALGYITAGSDLPGLEAAAVSPHPEVREKAVEALAALPDGRGADGLAAAMRDPDAGLRRKALTGLVKAGGAGMAGIASALSDADEGIRLEAAAAVARAGYAGAYGNMKALLADQSAAIRARALDYFSEAGGEGLSGLLAGLACDPDAGIRERAFARLAGIKGEDASAAIAEFYKCGGLGMRLSTLAELSSRDDGAARDCLLLALGDADAGVRKYAASALLARGAFMDVSRLYADPEPEIRRLAASATAAAASPEMLPTFKAQAADPDAEVRLLALSGLRPVPGDEAGALAAGLVDDPDAEVARLARGITLARRDAGAALGIARLAGDGNKDTRRAAFRALLEIPGEVADAGIYAAFRGGSGEDRVEALSALADRRAGQAADALRESLADPDREVRYAGLGLLGRHNLPETFYDGMTRSDYPEVRKAGYLGLWEMKGGMYEASLARAVAEPDAELRADAADRLLGIHLVPDKALVMKLLLDPEEGIRRAAMDAALKLPDGADKADALLAAADGPHRELVHDAARGLTALGDARALPHFEAAYGSDPWLFARAAAAVPGPEAVPVVGGMYRRAKDDDALRAFLVSALEGRGMGALLVLKDALSDPSRDVRARAVKALGSLNSPECIAPLGAALKDGDSDVRRAALLALTGIGGPEAAGLIAGAVADQELRGIALAHFSGAGKADAWLIAGRLDGLDAPALAVLADAVVSDLSGVAGGDAAYGLIVAGSRGDVATRQEAGLALASRSGDELVRGVQRLFERRRADAVSVGFACSVLTDPGALKEIISSINAGDSALMGAAVGQISQAREPYTVPALNEALKAEDAGIRERAASAIAAVPGAEAGKAASDAFHAHPGLRAVLWKSARDNGNARALLAAALHRGDAEVRGEAAAMLRDYAGEDAEALVAKAIGDADAAVRLAGVEAAVSQSMTDALLAAAGDGSAEVRRAAASALGRADGRVSEALAKLVSDPDAGVSEAALGSLVLLGDKVPPSVWAGVLRAPGDKETTLAALAALSGEGRGDAALAAGYLKDGDREVRAAAADCLVSRGVSALDAVHEALGDRKARRAALDVVMRIGDRSSEPRVLEVMPGLEGGELMMAVDALEKVGGEVGAERLAVLYRGGDTAMKVHAVRALGGAALSDLPEGVQATLADALASPVDELRFYGARSAGRLKVRGLKERLAQALAGERSGIIKAELGKALEAVSKE